MRRRHGVERSRRRDDRGASLVEFALIVPILALMLFGIIQFGIAFDQKQSVNSAAREGARFAAIPDNTLATIRDRARTSFSALAADQSTLTIRVYLDDDAVPANEITVATAEPCDGAAGSSVIVLVSKPYKISVPFLPTTNATLKGRGEFRCEAAP